MAKVILVCGKICCGKSTYAEKLCADNKAVLLSVDEIMLALFGLYAGDKHDEYVDKIKKHLIDKSAEIIETGISVILDWGFWKKDERTYMKEFYSTRGIEHEFHYIDIGDDIWKARLDKRNSAVLAGEVNAYIVDDNLAAKFEKMFEMPGDEEIDIRVPADMQSEEQNNAVCEFRQEDRSSG